MIPPREREDGGGDGHKQERSARTVGANTPRPSSDVNGLPLPYHIQRLSQENSLQYNAHLVAILSFQNASGGNPAGTRKNLRGGGRDDSIPSISPPPAAPSSPTLVVPDEFALLAPTPFFPAIVLAIFSPTRAEPGRTPLRIAAARARFFAAADCWAADPPCEWQPPSSSDSAASESEPLPEGL